MLKNIFKTEKQEEVKPPPTLAELEIEKATANEIQNACKTANRWEIQSRIDNLVKYIQKIPAAKPDESDEEKAHRRRILHEKVNVLRQCLIEKDREETAKRQQAQAEFSEQWYEENRGNMRYAYDTNVNLLRREGLGALQIIDWKTPTEPIVEIACLSGAKVKMDLRRIPANLCRNLSEKHFAPIYFTAETSGLLVNNKKTGLMQSPNFQPNKRIVIQNTTVAVMLV
jgi:hypothetical protein